MTINDDSRPGRPQCMCGSSKRVLNDIADDIKFIKENYSEMRNISMVWGFMGGIIPSIIIIIISILKLVMDNVH